MPLLFSTLTRGRDYRPWLEDQWREPFVGGSCTVNLLMSPGRSLCPLVSLTGDPSRPYQTPLRRRHFHMRELLTRWVSWHSHVAVNWRRRLPQFLMNAKLALRPAAASYLVDNWRTAGGPDPWIDKSSSITARAARWKEGRKPTRFSILPPLIPRLRGLWLCASAHAFNHNRAYHRTSKRKKKLSIRRWKNAAARIREQWTGAERSMISLCAN